MRDDRPGSETTDYDDSQWPLVSAPHTFNDVDTFDDWSPEGHAGEMDQWGGRTWYRKQLNAPLSWQGRSVVIEFEAVRQVGEIYVNGQFVGRSENGFLPFGIDLSPYLKYGEENLIAVMVDNTFFKDTEGGRALWHAYGGGAKFSWNNPHWHPAHGGLYRNVYLHVENSLHLTRPLFSNLGTVGTYAYAVEPSRERTGIALEAEVANQSKTTRAFSLRSRLLDRKGRIVWEGLSDSQTIKPRTRMTVKLEGMLDNPLLWEPAHPYVYRLRSELIEADAVVSVNEVPFGVRWFEFSRTEGFFINDRYLKLAGWGMKSVDGWPGLGAANPDWMKYHTLELMTLAGGNMVRWGHTAGAPAHIKAADQLGIITIQPGVDGEGDLEGHGWKVRAEAFRDSVIYYRNHPSILIWEGGNQSVTDAHAHELKNYVETYDPHGARAYAHRRADEVVKPYLDLSISTEGSGFLNSLPTVEGEYNREESPRRVWDRLTPPYEDWHAVGTYDLTAEHFAVNQIFQFNKIAPTNHGGGANWIFVDSTSGGRVQSEVTRTSGELDAMRLPKEAYHVCRVLFTVEPDLHIIGHWNYPEGTRKNIAVAADCDTVELFLNGQSLGRKARTNEIEPPRRGDGKNADLSRLKHPYLFVFDDVVWAPGTLKAVGYVDGQAVAEHSLSTAGPAVALRLAPITGPQGPRASGSDAILFDVEAVDAEGRRNPVWVGRVDFSHSGPATWRGGYNSGRINSTNHRYLELESGINRVVLRTQREPGAVTLTARAEGLACSSALIEVQPFPTTNGLSHQLPAMPAAPELGNLPPANRSVPKSFFSSMVLETDLVGRISYSGPSERVAFETLSEGARVYSDDRSKIKIIPEALIGAEIIALPEADWDYSAVDLLQFSAKEALTVYVFYDKQIEEKMHWLTTDFEATGMEVEVRNWQGDPGHFSVFKREVAAGESVLFGSNVEGAQDKRWMMIIAVRPR